METAAPTLIANEDWIADLKSGRAEATAALRARIREGLAAALARHSDVGDADLDDFTQDALMRVLERLHTFRGDSRFTTWAMAVALRVSLTALRRRRWAAARFDGRLPERPAFQAPERPADAAGARAELFAVLRAAIDSQLSARQRRVLLGELEGVPQVVLAERLSVSPGAIYKVSHDARKKLKAALARAGFDAENVLALLAESAAE